MDTKTNLVTCSICGHRMAIPPGFEGKACRCSKCGTALQAGEDILSVKLDFDLGLPASAKPSVATSAKSKPEMRADLKAVAIKAALYGLLGLCVGAIVLGLLMGLLALATAAAGAGRTDNFFIAFKGGVDFGLLGGFLLGAIISLMYMLEPTIPRGSAIGACVGLAATLVHYVFENIFIAQSDTSAFINGIIGCCGGAAVAAMTLWYMQYRESK